MKRFEPVRNKRILGALSVILTLCALLAFNFFIFPKVLATPPGEGEILTVGQSPIPPEQAVQPSEKATEEAQADDSTSTALLDNCILTGDLDTAVPEGYVTQQRAIETAVAKVNEWQEVFGRIENHSLLINILDGTKYSNSIDGGEPGTTAIDYATAPYGMYPSWHVSATILKNIDVNDFKHLTDYGEALAALEEVPGYSYSDVVVNTSYSIDVHAQTSDITWINKSGITALDQNIIDRADNKPGIPYKDIARREAHEYAKALFPELTVSSEKMVGGDSNEFFEGFRYQLTLSDNSYLVLEFTEWYNQNPPVGKGYYDEGAVYINYFPATYSDNRVYLER